MAEETILIVEDEMLLALELESTLENLGYKVCAKVLDSESAVKAAKDFLPDLILMDFKIKGAVDGIETAKQIQTITNSPIIFIATYVDEDTFSRIKVTSPYGYLTKPVQEKDLRIILEMALHQSKIEKELKETKEALERSERSNKMLADVLPDFIFRMNYDGTIVDDSARTNQAMFLSNELSQNKQEGEVSYKTMAMAALPSIQKSIDNSCIELFEYEIPDGVRLKIFEGRATKINENEALVIVRDITDRKQMEKEILSTKKRIETLVTSSTVMLYACNAFGDFDTTFVSDNILPITGFTKEEFLSKGFWENHLHPEDAANIIKYKAKLFAFNFCKCEYRFMFKDGAYYWMYDELKLIRDQYGNPLEMVGTWVNITEQKKIENRLKENQEQLAGITANLPGVVFQFIVDPDGTMSISYVDGKVEELFGLSREKETLFSQFVERVHPDSLEPFLQSVENSVKNFVPWNFEGKFNKSEKETIWFQGLSTPFKNTPVIVFNGIMLDITENKKSEEALIASEEKFRISVENSPIGIYYVNLKGDFLYGNKVAEDIIGFKKEEMAGKNFLKAGLLSFKDVLYATKLFAMNIMGKSTGPDQFELNRKDGQKVFVEIKTQVINIGGQRVVMGMVHDISERRFAEEALLESEERYRFMFAKNPQSMWIYDLETLKFLEVNNAAINQYGYTREEFLSKTLKDIRPTEDIPALMKDIEITQNEYNSAGVWRHVKKNGELVIVEITSHFITFNGRPARHVLVKDITEYKRAEKKLRESEDRYRDLIENSSDLICTHDLNGNLLSANKVAAIVTGYSEDELLKMKMQDLIVPEYRRVFTAYLAKIKAVGKAKGLMTIQTKTGERRIWEYNNTLRTQGVASPLVRGMVRDITEQKIAQESLQESELRFKQVAENAREWIWEVDKNGLYTYASSVSKDILGYRPDEIVGKKYFFDFFDQKEKEKIKQVAFEIFKRKENFKSLVNLNRHKDGRRIILSTSGVPMLDNKGSLIGYRGVDIDITERKHAEEEILMLAHSLRSINESVVITNMEDNIIFINESFLKTYSYSEDELIGKHISIVHPLNNPPELIKEILPATLRGGWTGELLNKRKNGNEFPIYLSTSVVRNREGIPIGLIGVIQDITERKKIEKELQDYRENLENIVEERTHELQQSEEKFRILAESSEDTIMRFNRQCQHLYVNPQVNKQTGIKAEAFLGKKHSELGFPEHLVSLWETTLENVFESKGKNRIEFQLPNGMWMDWILVPEIEENGEVQTIITSGRDITKLKEYEAEINKALQKEKELNELKSRFISTVSHEFRTPLASILSSSQLIQRYSKKWDEVKLDEHHERIKLSINNLTELLNDLLALSKNEIKTTLPEQEKVNLEETLATIIKEVMPLLTAKHSIEFSYDIKNRYFYFSTKSLKRIFSNLLSNAIKFSPLGGKIKLLVKESETTLIFELSDEGMGINGNEFQNIFEPFYRSKTSEHITGSGLGLSIVKQTVEQYGGTIAVESKVGEGTVVKISIPIKEIKK